MILVQVYHLLGMSRPFFDPLLLFRFICFIKRIFGTIIEQQGSSVFFTPNSPFAISSNAFFVISAGKAFHCLCTRSKKASATNAATSPAPDLPIFRVAPKGGFCNKGDVAWAQLYAENYLAPPHRRANVVLVGKGEKVQEDGGVVILFPG